MKPIFLAVAALLFFPGCERGGNDRTAASGIDQAIKYGSTPSLFAANVISTGLNERDAAMPAEGDTFYFSVWSNRGGTLCESRWNGRAWSTPVVMPFSGEYSDVEPFLRADGTRLYFASNRPGSGDTAAGDYDIWYVDKRESGWAEPVNIGPPVNGPGDEFYPSLTDAGSLYFTATREPLATGENIYVARPDGGGGFREPEYTGDAINSTRGEFNAFVAPDESYLIFSTWGRDDAVGGVDLYISFRTPTGKWTDAMNMGPRVNGPRIDYCPFVTRDGKDLYFTSERSEEKPRPHSYQDLQRRLTRPEQGSSDIYRMKAGIIEELRARALPPVE